MFEAEEEMKRKVWIAKFEYKGMAEAGVFSTRERAKEWLERMMNAPGYWKNGELDDDALRDSDWAGTTLYEHKIDSLNNIVKP